MFTGNVGDSPAFTGDVGDSTVPTGGVGYRGGVGCSTGGTAKDRDPEWTEMSSSGLLMSGGDTAGSLVVVEDSSPGVTEVDMVIGF